LNFDERLSSWALVTTQPPSYDAYLEYMEGRAIYMQQLNGPMALPHLLRASELDTNFLTPVLFAASAAATGGGWELADSLTRVLDGKRGRLIPLERLMLDWVIGMTRGGYPAALEAMRQAADIAPSPEMFTITAMTALAINRPRDALDALNQIDPESGLMRGFIVHWMNLTTALHFLSEHRRELSVARHSLELYPGNPFLTVSLTRALVALGRLNEAIEALGESPSHPPMNSVAAGEDAWITSTEMMAHGHPEEAAALQHWAIEWFESLDSEILAKPLYRYGYARQLYVTGRLDEAEGLFQELTGQIPDSVSFRGYLGSVAARRGDRDRAIGLLHQAFDAGFEFTDAFHRDEDLLLLHGYEPFEELMRPKG